MLNPRTCRRILDLTSLAATAGMVVAGWWAIAPLDKTESDLADPRGVTKSLTNASRTEAPLELDPSLLNRSLRGPLVDPPEPPPVVKSAPPPAIKPRRKPVARPPKVKLTLAGTMISDSGSVAIVSNPAGEFDIKGVGQTLDFEPAGITVTKIESDSVTLDFKGSELKIEVDKTISAAPRASRRKR